MSTTIGKRMIDGACVKYHTVGGGFVRDVAGNVFEFVENLGVKKGAQLIRGHGLLLVKVRRRRLEDLGRRSVNFM